MSVPRHGASQKVAAIDWAKEEDGGGGRNR